MSQQNKPREWYLHLNSFGEVKTTWTISEIGKWFDTKEQESLFRNSVKVIEYSAFEAAQSEKEHLKAKLESREQGNLNALKIIEEKDAKISELEHQLNSYRNVLKDYFNGSAIVSYDYVDTRAMHLEKSEHCEYSGKKINSKGEMDENIS